MLISVFFYFFTYKYLYQYQWLQFANYSLFGKNLRMYFQQPLANNVALNRMP